jgi:Integrase core domain
VKISKASRHELLQVLRKRYRDALKEEKTKILDEFIDIGGSHRKYAIYLLTRDEPIVPAIPKPSRAIYSEAVRQALIILWEAADRICGKRLKAVLPSLIGAMELHGHLALDSGVRQLLLRISPATIDRLLTSVRGTAGRRRKRKSTTKASREVPIRTFADWKDPEPGFLEVDFVSHGGASMRGAFLWSLVATDVCSGWTEAVALVAREQSLVVEGLEIIRRQFPVPIRGIDSDNDSAFINETLQGYCEQAKIEFTRSRPYHKNDQAWIEQKNGSVIRRFVGNERHSGLIAGQCLARLYKIVRLYVNYFQPSFKLLSKTRDGAKIKKRYHRPATPCDRLLALSSVSSDAKSGLRTEFAVLDPLELLHQIREGQSALAALCSGDTSRGSERESLKEFLAKLPEQWRAGEVRPTHRDRQSSMRHWRTRKDPFEEVWPEILLCLQRDPDSTAKSLMEQLQRDYPGRFPPAQLRTLQRRIREWRYVMAKSLVHICQDGSDVGDQTILVGESRTTNGCDPL